MCACACVCPPGSALVTGTAAAGAAALATAPLPQPAAGGSGQRRGRWAPVDGRAPARKEGREAGAALPCPALLYPALPSPARLCPARSPGSKFGAEGLERSAQTWATSERAVGLQGGSQRFSCVCFYWVSTLKRYLSRDPDEIPDLWLRAS